MKTTPENSNSILNIFPTFFMLAIFGGGFVISVLSIQDYKIPEKITWKSSIKGEFTSDFESKLDENIAFRQLAIDLWGTAEYALFKEGRKGVLIGENGWLFTDEEFVFYPKEADEISYKLALIQEIKIQLEKHGTQLIVALVPAKTRVYKEKLGRYDFPSYTQKRYDDFRKQLLVINTSVPNLLEPLLTAKIVKETFLSTDTHWTPFGATLIASTIAEEAKLVGFSSFQTENFTTKEQETIDHEGDLLSFIPLGKFQYIGPKPDKLTKLHTSKESDLGSGLGLFW